MVAFMCLPGAVLLFVLGLILQFFREFFWEIAAFALIVGLIALAISMVNAADAQHGADVQSKKNYDNAVKAYNEAVKLEKLRVQRELPEKNAASRTVKRDEGCKSENKSDFGEIVRKEYHS